MWSELDEIFGCELTERAKAQACAIIEAQSDLKRIRQARRAVLEEHLLEGKLMPCEADPTAIAVLSSLDTLHRIERYEVIALRNRDRAVMDYLRACAQHPRIENDE